MDTPIPAKRPRIVRPIYLQLDTLEESLHYLYSNDVEVCRMVCRSWNSLITRNMHRLTSRPDVRRLVHIGSGNIFIAFEERIESIEEAVKALNYYKIAATDYTQLAGYMNRHLVWTALVTVGPVQMSTNISGRHCRKYFNFVVHAKSPVKFVLCR